ncbi:MAG: four helix bundle protein [Candidatus Chisholmbacteria bacterium]|nr:four helix bundle protein [Candidatus Chisholmbacteria bacterium]
MSVARQKEFLDRLKKFAIDCDNYQEQLPRNPTNRVYSFQLLKSSSSIPANYAESMCSLTTNDWIHDINKCRKESNESEVWLDLLSRRNTVNKKEGLRLHQEAKEFVLIFSRSLKTARRNKM